MRREIYIHLILLGEKITFVTTLLLPRSYLIIVSYFVKRNDIQGFQKKKGDPKRFVIESPC